jgi:hypothetical protein
LNLCRVNGVIYSDEVRMKTDRIHRRPMCDLLLSAPFDHPHYKPKENYRAIMRTYVFGEDAEWLYDTISYEGAHVELRQAYLNIRYEKEKGKTHYALCNIKLDRERCGDVPDDYKPYNLCALGGYFNNQWASEDYEGVHRVGISMSAPPNKVFIGSKYNPIICVWFYADHADEIDGKLKKGDPIDYVEGVIQPWHNSERGWSVYIHATKLRV